MDESQAFELYARDEHIDALKAEVARLREALALAELQCQRWNTADATTRCFACGVVAPTHSEDCPFAAIREPDDD